MTKDYLFHSEELAMRKNYNITLSIVFPDFDENLETEQTMPWACEARVEVHQYGNRLSLEVLGDLTYDTRICYVKKGPNKGQYIDTPYHDIYYILEQVDEVGLVDHAVEMANREVLRQAGAAI